MGSAMVAGYPVSRLFRLRSAHAQRLGLDAFEDDGYLPRSSPRSPPTSRPSYVPAHGSGQAAVISA